MSVGLRWRLRWRLSVLWALQWAITGAILTYLPLYFAENGISQEQLGQLLAVSALGLWVAPFVVGQVCDRWLASEKYLAIAHLVGGVTLVSIPIATRVFRETGANFPALISLVGLFAVAYFPTIPLASSLTFRHLSDPDAQFGKVRIWGTVGWVLAGLSLSVWLGQQAAADWLVTAFPACQAAVTQLQESLPTPSKADCFHIAAVLSFALSGFSLFLPSTPPARSDRGKVAPLETLRMFRDPRFSMLIAISFLLAIVVSFYPFAVPTLLEQSGFAGDWVPAVMTIGQISEFPAMLLLPVILKRYGLKATFAVGMTAWLIRYTLFAIGQSGGLLLTGVAFHGVCHVFLIIVLQLYVDSQCRSDLRASAQNLFAFITMGVAMPLGFLAAGTLAHWCETGPDGQMNYQAFFAAPAVMILVLLAVFVMWFRLDEAPQSGDDANSIDAQSDPIPERV